MNGADWSKRYPRIVEEAARVKGSAVIDAEVVCLIKRGIADFDMLHSRTADHLAVACAFDLLMHNGDDLRRQALEKSLGPEYLALMEGFRTSTRKRTRTSVRRLRRCSEQSIDNVRVSLKNPKAPAATRALDGTF